MDDSDKKELEKHIPAWAVKVSKLLEEKKKVQENQEKST
jgi:hypothetical protein